MITTTVVLIRRVRYFCQLYLGYWRYCVFYLVYGIPLGSSGLAFFYGLEGRAKKID